MVYQPDQSVFHFSLHWNCNSVQCEFHRTHIKTSTKCMVSHVHRW